MEAETARLIEIGITAAGALAWGAGLGFVRRATREPPQPDPEAPGRFRPLPPDTLAGRVETTGTGDAVLSALIGACASRLAGSGRLEVKERGRSSFEFRTEGGMGPRLVSGRFETRPAGGDRVEVHYQARLGGVAALRHLAWICLALGLAAVVAGAALILTMVAPHPDPSVRGQALQGLQIVHFLWPPFLFSAMHRRMRRWMRAQVESTIHNLPYLKRPGA